MGNHCCQSSEEIGNLDLLEGAQEERSKNPSRLQHRGSKSDATHELKPVANPNREVVNQLAAEANHSKMVSEVHDLGDPQFQQEPLQVFEGN